MPDTTTANDVVVFGDHDARTLEQIHRCAEAAPNAGAVLCADGHFGYSMPVGGVVAYLDHVSPNAVGYDIACGNKAVLTDLTLADIRPDLPGIADEINRRISFGMGRKNAEPVDHPVLDEIRDAAVKEQRALYDTAAAQLGTVGAGNHYVDVFADEHDRVWVGVHFGSRGFGHKTCTGFLAIAQGGRFGDKAGDGEMASPPILIPADSTAGQAYVEAMELAGRYAYAGRDLVCRKVLEILGARSMDEIHNNHNLAFEEEHAGDRVWVVRKGATPAFPGQRGFVGGTMGEESVILEGVESDASQRALYSTVHGAGRAMSRTKAAGKIKPVWECTARDCDHRQTTGEYRVARERAGVAQHDRFTTCPRHPEGRMKKFRRRVSDGLIDFSVVQKDLGLMGIHLRGAAADEAPGAYKRLPEVLAHHEGTVEVLHRLRPLVVVMAGPDTVDPFRD